MQQTEHPATGETPTMQFILDGKLYDTATAATVAISRGVIEDDPYLPAGAVSQRYDSTLYRTKSGRFFMHSHTTTKYGRGKPIVQDSAGTMTPIEALKWIEQEGAMLLDSAGLPLPEEG